MTAPAWWRTKHARSAATGAHGLDRQRRATMTWKEFIARVEEQGVTENTEIAWIDVIGWRRSPVVTRADHGMVIIVQRDGRTA
jgi:hypothetical protein